MQRNLWLCSAAIVSAWLSMSDSALAQAADEEAEEEQEAQQEEQGQEAQEGEAQEGEGGRRRKGRSARRGRREEEEGARPVSVGVIEVRLGGMTLFGVQAGTDNTITGDNDQGYIFYMDNELLIEANGATERGILYGSTINLEVGTGGLDGDPQETAIDEAALFFSGKFGRFELGRRDGAEQLMYVGAQDAQAGTGGIDGDIPNLNFIEFENTDIAAKTTYFTPRVAGFQLGASFTPDYEDNGAENQFQGEDLEGENGISPGINWVGHGRPAGPHACRGWSVLGLRIQLRQRHGRRGRFPGRAEIMGGGHAACLCRVYARCWLQSPGRLCAGNSGQRYHQLRPHVWFRGS